MENTEVKNAKIKSQYDRAKAAAKIQLDRNKKFLDIAYARLANTAGFKSRVREGSLSSIVFERTCRVMANNPTGEIIALTQADKGKSQLMNLFWNRYVIPNANMQYPMDVKLKLWNYYADIFGICAVLATYSANDQYVGPDFRVLMPENVYPQAGRLSPNDADYVFVVTYHSKRELKEQIGKKGWDDKIIKELLEQAKGDNVPTQDEDPTNLQEERGEANYLHAGQIKLVTKYLKGVRREWITFAPDYGFSIVRMVKNDSPTGQIPVKFKYSMPLLDSFYGMGDIERGESLQLAIDSSVNLGLDYFKFIVYPITQMSKNMNPSQYPFRPGAKWRMEQTDFVKPVDFGSNSMNAQQAMYQFLKGALLNQNGTTDTMISGSDKLPGFGKTPEALQALERRENARDAFSRAMLESACEELFQYMIEMVGVKQAVPVDFNIFGEEVKLIAEAGYVDVLDAFESSVDGYVGSDNTFIEDATSERVKKDKLTPVFNSSGVGKLTVKPAQLVGKYKYTIDAGSTAANDKNQEFERINSVIELLGTPFGEKMAESLAENKQKFDYKALFDQFLQTTGIHNRDKMVIPMTEVDEENMDDSSGVVDKNLALTVMGPPEDGSEVFDPEMLSEQSRAVMEGVVNGGK